MRARTLALILLTALSFYGCKKEKETVFEVTGLADMDIRYSEVRAIPLSIQYRSGNKQTITLSVEGLPQGAHASFIPNSNTPPFDTKMQLSTQNVKGGDYTLKLIAKPTEGTARTYDVKMKVRDVEETGCALELSGSYTSFAQVYHNLRMTGPTLEPTTEKNRIVFTDCEPQGFYADLNCSNNSLTIPRQRTSSANYVSGTGTYNGLLIYMSFQLEDTLGNIIRRQDVNFEKKW